MNVVAVDVADGTMKGCIFERRPKNQSFLTVNSPNIPIDKGQLDESKSLLECEVQGTRFGCQTLLCASNDNGNRVTLS